MSAEYCSIMLSRYCLKVAEKLISFLYILINLACSSVTVKLYTFSFFASAGMLLYTMAVFILSFSFPFIFVISLILVTQISTLLWKSLKLQCLHDFNRRIIGTFVIQLTIISHNKNDRILR